MQTGNRNQKVIQAIVALSHQLQLQTVAEGIETAQQMAVLKQLGCEYGQGRFFSDPLTADAVTAMLARGGGTRGSGT